MKSIYMRGVFLLLCLLVQIFAFEKANIPEYLPSLIYSNQISDSSIADSTQFKGQTTIPPGVLYGSFTKNDGPFLIEGSVIIPSGQTLEFGPGCVIYMGGDYSTITVFGQIIAKGSKEEPVVFRSAKKQPNPWDWDRIYCRSRNKSIFEYCEIRHSNYGLFIENGSASIQHCIFEKNSLHGLVVKNSEVSLGYSTFKNGHVLAIRLQAGAQFTGDSLVAFDNVSALGCETQSLASLDAGKISKNSNGIIVMNGAAVSTVALEIVKNRVGIVSEKEIPKKMREMVFDNSIDVKLLSNAEIKLLFKEPESIRSVVLPKSATDVKVGDNFTPGFSAISAVADPTSSFIGNVTAGFSYYQPKTLNHPITGDYKEQTRYPSGFQPEVQVFASGKRGSADVNLLMDLYGNNWLAPLGYVGKNMFNLSINYSRQNLVFGDFFESGSETSISGRQMTGIKYSGDAHEMGGGLKRFEYKLAAGESEISKDVGDHEINIYNEVVDTGMSVRQQITYVASGVIKPTRNSTIGIKGLIARDQIDKPLLRKPISDTAAPQPIEASTGCIDGTVDLLNGKLQLSSELDLGTHDTISEDGFKDVSWYNPRAQKALPRVFSLFKPDSFRQNSAFSLGAHSNYKGYSINLSYLQIGKKYFSAGNPYLEVDRRNTKFAFEKQINQNLSTSGDYTYERTALSQIPTDRNEINIRGEYTLGENKPSISSDITFRVQSMKSSERVVKSDLSTEDVEYNDVQTNNLIGIEEKHNLPNGINYNIRYQFLWDNDISEHPDESKMDQNDGTQHQINGSVSFKFRKLIKNKVTLRLATKQKNRDSLTGFSYKIGDQINITAIPRKLNFTLSGEFNRKTEKEFGTTESDSVGHWLDPVKARTYNIDFETKYTINARLSLALKMKHENNYDETEGSGENNQVTVGGLNLTVLF